MILRKEIGTYYNELASDYDNSRFANTYGQFIDSQEQLILSDLLKSTKTSQVVELGCGTGRFLEYADTGVDISENMIHESLKKFPSKRLFIESADDTHFDNASFESAYSFHVFMHLEKTTVLKILSEAHRILKNGGRFIFDVPSAKRRNLVNYKSNGWHGATSFSIDELNALVREEWTLNYSRGILFFPIHRFPKVFRKVIFKLDNLLCNSILKEYSSYLVLELIKK